MKYHMYANAFVECSDGWRWNFIITDEVGIFEIRYEEWNESERKWVDKGIAESLHLKSIPQIIDALKVILAQNELG